MSRPLGLVPPLCSRAACGVHAQRGAAPARERSSHDAEHAPLVLVVARGAPVVDGARDHVVDVARVLPPVELQVEAAAQRFDGALAADEARH
eukprot:5535941-Prymnesium_polylepis.1